MQRKVSIKAGWDRIAGSYQRTTRISTGDVHYGVLAPGESKLQLLGDVAGKHVLELGCGGGQNTIALAKMGAIAEGIDISEKQLDFARTLADKEGVNVRFYLGSMEDLSQFHDETKDIVISSFAIGYVENLNRLFKEVCRILKPLGNFIFADAHPMTTRGKPVKLDNKRMWAVSEYFARGAVVWSWPKFDDGSTAIFRSYHRTFQDYSDALNESFLRVERILEPEPTRISGKKRPSAIPCFSPLIARDYHIWRQIPYTIIFKCAKPSM